jgi:predicted phosphodiesterase
MRFLCVSDIHGHAASLRAVLDTARGLGFDQLIACGDHFFPGPDPLGVWQLLTEHKAVCVQGIGDRALVRLAPAGLVASTPEARARLERLKQVHAELGQLILARIAKLPAAARIPLENADELLAVHGSPVDPTEPFSPELSDDEMNALVGEDMADIIVCGGSHVAFERVLPDVHVVGVGSVGEDPAQGFASAALVETSAIGHQVKLLSVRLD